MVDAGAGAWPMEVAREVVLLELRMLRHVEEDESAGAHRLLEEACVDEVMVIAVVVGCRRRRATLLPLPDTGGGDVGPTN